MPKRKTTPQFIKEAKLKHGDKYDYSITEYTKAKDKLKIICKKHGVFEQEASSHLLGCGCQKCANEKISSSRRSSTEMFIEKSSVKHDFKYSYDKCIYKNNTTKVIITCPVHGDFEQIPSNHVNHGKGCKKCASIKIGEKITKRAIGKKNWDIEQPTSFKLIPISKEKFTKVSNEDFEYLKTIPWTISGDGNYVLNSYEGYLHRFIMEPTGNLVVDHINGDGLDNRRENLRICTSVQNIYNSKSNSDSTSTYKGVCIIKENKFMSQIGFNNVNYNLGTFTDEIEAAKVYDKKALELFGEFAYLNFPELKEDYLKSIK